MSEEIKGGGAAPDSEASGQTQEVQEAHADSVGGDSVKYDTYRRTLGEAKKYKGKVDELQSQLTEMQQSQLANEGKKDELIDSLRKQNAELNGKLSKAVGNFAKSKVHEVMMSEATRLGCQDPELLLRAYGNDIDGIDFDDSFNPDRDQIRITLDKIKGERPYLFNKPAPQIGSHQIKPDGVKEPEAKGMSSLKEDELMEAWAKAEKV